MSNEEQRYHFRNIAHVVKMYRLNSNRDNSSRPLSQSQLSELLGYRNGQFISNVERGLCSVPLKKLKLLCETLNIPERVIKDAMVADYVEDINFSLRGDYVSKVQADSASEPIGAGEYIN